MVLTFKSSTPQVVTVVDQDGGTGRRRIGRAVQSEHNPKMWNLRIEHPSGRAWPGSFTGTDMEAVVALADLMNRTKNEYLQDKARGDKRHEGVADRSVQVSEQGDGGVILKNYLTR